MFAFMKYIFCACGKDVGKTTRKQEAVSEDKHVREALSEKDLDKGLKDSMIASDPVAKY